MTTTSAIVAGRLKGIGDIKDTPEPREESVSQHDDASIIATHPILDNQNESDSDFESLTMRCNYFAVAHIFLAVAATVTRHGTSSGISNSTSSLDWKPCDPARVLNNTKVQCATLPVPLDYTDTSQDKTLVLELTKYPAQNGPSKGSILLNFGGPGEDGHINMVLNAPYMNVPLGGQFDLISWDPRGTGNTLPFDCFKSNPIGQAADTYLQTTWFNSSDSAPGHLWAAAEIMADACHESLQDYGDLVGQTFSARDLMRIVDALEEDGMLRYWGISGGAILGATAAAMFPERMDRVLLDGVVNAHEHYHSFGQPEMFARLDASFEGLLKACVADPVHCPLARNRTLEDIETSLRAAIDKLKYSPELYEGPSIVDDNTVKRNILSNLYAPTLFPTLVAGLDALLKGDVATFLKLTTIELSLGLYGQALQGIVCGDKMFRASSFDEVKAGIDKYFATSKWFPDVLALNIHGFECARWKFDAKERYTGDFNVKTKNPMLIIGNTYDPVTSFDSAVNMSSGFTGSVLLEHGGFGHLTYTNPSNCTNKYIFDYFTTVSLPPVGTKCEPNDGPLNVTMLSVR